jgi:PAS domain S-box-containing protein
VTGWDLPGDLRACAVALDLAPDPAFLVDSAGVARYANSAATRRWPTARSDAPFQDVIPVAGMVSPDASPGAVLTRALRDGAPVELLLPDPDGPPQRVALSAIALPRADGAWAVVTLRPRATAPPADPALAGRYRALQALNDLAARLLRLNTVAGVYEAALDGVLDIMGAPRGAVALTDDAHGEFRLATHRGYSAASQAHTDHLPYDVDAAHNLARIHRDIVVIHRDDPLPVALAVLAAEEAETAVLLPLFRDDRVSGVLSYVLAEHRDVTSADRELLRTAATYVGAALDRAALYEAAEAERARLAHILEQLPVGVFIAEGDPRTRTFRWAEINRAGEEQFGAPIITPGVESETFTILHLDGRPYTPDELPLQRAIWTGQPISEQELVFRYHSGEERVFTSRVTLLGESEGLRQAVAVSQDITVRKRLEDTVRRQAAATEAAYARLAALVNGVDVALATFDAAGRLQVANEMWGRIYGRPAGPGARLDAPGAGPLARHAAGLVDRVLATGAAAQMREVYQPAGDGRAASYADWSVLPLRDDQGAVLGALIATVDVTGKVQARREVEDQRGLLETVLGSAPVGVMLLDRDLRIVNINAEYVSMTGRPLADLLGHSLHDVSPLKGRRAPTYERALAGEELEEHNFSYTFPDGRVRHYDMRYRPLRDPQGAVTGLVCTALDITEAVRAREEREAQRARLETIFSGAPVGLAFLDREMRYVDMNAAYARIYEIDPAQALGRRLYDIIPDAITRAGPHQRALAGEDVDLESIAAPAVRGEMRYYDLHFRPLREDGVITGLLNTVSDVTDKARAGAAVEAQRRLLETIIEGAPVGLAFFDQEMRIVNFNPAWGRLVGLRLADVRGQSFYDVVPETRARADLYQRVIGGEPIDLTNVPFHTRGESGLRYCDVHLRPMLDADGAGVGMLSAAVDVTERHALDQQKDEFIALASHELKTPLTTIKGYAQAGLRAGYTDDDRMLRTLGIINEQSDRLTRLINELLDVTRVQAGALPLNKSRFDLGHAVREIARDLHLTAPDFTIPVDLAPDDTPVFADRHRVEQVILNLVQNAIKYSGDSRRVDIQMTRRAAEAVVMVRDYGEGIPAEQQAQVFDRFFRASNVRDRQGGLGLGLFIAASIVERHGGRMWLESAVGEGSAFYFALPLATDA